MARVVLIAYTTYIHDGRVKREAEALANRGDRVDAITLKAGRTGLINRQPAGRDRYGRPAFGAPGQRPGAPPRKKVAAAGKKIKKTEITTPAEHKRVVRMGETRQSPVSGEELIEVVAFQVAANESMARGGDPVVV